MTGGTDRVNHSEVGSSYIHFNYTPDGDKCTPSLFGDVPRGVMLDQPPIFLGGQGGAAGPVRVGFGTVVVAGCILREDILEDQRLVVVGPHREAKRALHPAHATATCPGSSATTSSTWPTWWRSSTGTARCGSRSSPGRSSATSCSQGALDAARGRQGRADQAAQGHGRQGPGRQPVHRASCGESRRPGRAVPGRRRVAAGQTGEAGGRRARHSCPGSGEAAAGETSYIKAIKSLTPALSGQGVEWLQQTVDDLCARADALLPSLGICAPGKR